jgi:hypothetical protein
MRDEQYQSAELHDPQSGQFATAGPLVTPRFEQTASLLADGLVLIVGGEDRNNLALTSAKLCNPQTCLFIPIGSMEMPRAKATATLLPDGRY